MECFMMEKRESYSWVISNGSFFHRMRSLSLVWKSKWWEFSSSVGDEKNQHSFWTRNQLLLFDNVQTGKFFPFSGNVRGKKNIWRVTETESGSWWWVSWGQHTNHNHFTCSPFLSCLLTDGIIVSWLTLNESKRAIHPIHYQPVFNLSFSIPWKWWFVNDN